MKIDDRLMKRIHNWYKNEKSSDSIVSDKQFAINTLNLLLLHTEQPDLWDTIVGLFLVIERLGIEDYCNVIIERFADGKLRALFNYNESNEEEIENET